MSDELSGVKPEGKGLGVGGFIISLVGLIFAPVVAIMVAASMGATFAATGEMGGKGLMYFWVVLCIASVVLSAMGMMKLGKTGGKKGLAIAGLVIGIVALLWSIFLLMGLETAANLGDESIKNLQNLQTR